MKVLSRLVALLLVLGVAASAHAQIQTGSILVKAADDQGGLMPGVAITISSPVLVAGTMTAVTDAEGVYRFPSLVPGTYTVKVELQGFSTIIREGIVITTGQTTPVEIGMKVATVAETITVTGSSPTVDTTSAVVAVNLSAALIQGTPGGPRHLGSARGEGARPRDEPAGRRRHLRRPAGDVQRARHQQHAEHVLPERHQRRRSGVERRGRLLLRLRRVRRHPGVDRCARHHRADLGRVPEHDHQDRRRPLETGRARSPTPTTACRDATTRMRRSRPTASSRAPTPRRSCRTSTSPAAVRWSRASCASSARSATGACIRTWPCRTRCRCSTRPTSPRASATSRGRRTRTTRFTGFYSRQRYNKAEPPAERAVGDRAGFDRRRRGHVRRRPGAVNGVIGKNFFIDARGGREQDSVPDLLQRRQPGIAGRHVDQHHLRNNASQVIRTATATSECHGPVLRGSGARRTSRNQVRLRLHARHHHQPDHPHRQRRTDLQRRQRRIRAGAT